MNAQSEQEALELLLSKPEPSETETNVEKQGFIIGVTGCPAGVAHTYLAAEALEKGAAALGYDIKVETNGSIGVKNSPTQEEIERADAIVVACDKQVDMARFAGKRVISTNVKAPIKDAQGLIKQALNASSYQAEQAPTNQSVVEKASQARSDLYRYLMNGVSHMIPFVVTGGLLIALALAIGGEPSESGMAIPAGSMWNQILEVGVVAFTLMIPILAGYIAYAIADRPALTPGLIGGCIMADMGGGFLGCIVAGFIAGGVVFQLKKIPLSANMTALGAYFIYPLLGTLISAGIVLWGIGEPIKLFMSSMNEFLASMAGASKMVLGTILGGMTAFDMGGPINKVATLFAQTQVDTQPWLMGGVGIAICTPPLGMALATFLFKNKFSKQEQEAGKAAAIMGSIGISEGAIPFAANDPMRVLPSIVAGGIVGCVFGFMTDVLLHAPWGGLITAPVSSNIPMYVVGIALGSLTTAVIVGFWKPVAVETEEDMVEAAVQAQTAPVAGEGEYDIVAVTCCPSGVAHTFMAAKALEKAGLAAGLKIKVETQGQNGIQNRISDLDVANARLVILAHDIQVKDAHRFANANVIECSTKEAMKKAATMVAI
ncbi:UNVERIFIED_CONTAM: hypothetical protein GTU68_049405 [Idotea baltica]|nr:hypothetical protein [Idotea baltica]